MTTDHDGETGDPTSTRLDAGNWETLTKTWRSAEFSDDWGLRALHADYAYALGFSGKGVKLGVVDSGVYALHPDLDDGRIVPVTTRGEYHADGYDYEALVLTTSFAIPVVTRQEVLRFGDGTTWTIREETANAVGAFAQTEAIEAIDASGNVTIVYRTYYADVGPRDSSRFEQGSAFDVSGTYDEAYNDSHGTHVTGTLAAERDGVGMHGVAFGSVVFVANTHSTDAKVYGPNADYAYFTAAYGAVAASGARAINNSWGSSSLSDSFDTLADLTAAYARLFGKKTYADAAADAALDYGLVQVWAAGNNGAANPDTRSSLAYFRPELEANWLVVGAATLPRNGQTPTPDNLEIAAFSNKAGVSKYWTVFAAGDGISSTVAPGGFGGDPDPLARYDAVSGTSMSSPHGTGALGIVMDRYSYIGNEAARDVLLTTATHRDALSRTPDAHRDAPNAIWGWGVLDLKKAMNGPGQFLGEFEVVMTAAESDVWTNPIGEGALIQRKAEDAAEQAAWRATVKAKGWDETPPTEASSLQDQVAYAVGTARAEAAAERVYEGSLVKDGEGTLTLAGAYSSYSGGTWLKGGTLVLGAAAAAGLGAIRFAEGAQRLVIDAAAMIGTSFSNAIASFGFGDVIDLNFLSYGSSVAGYLADEGLKVVGGAIEYSFNLSGLPANVVAAFASDTDGSTLLTLAKAAAPIKGTGDDDRLSGTRGDDLFESAGGRDTIYAGLGDDRVSAGDGNDTVFGGAGKDTLFGEAGDDRLVGEAGDDLLRGGEGNDRLLGGAGEDNLGGDAGNDNLSGDAGNDVLTGGDGDDILNGGDGTDHLSGGNGNDYLDGGAGEDTLDGGSGSDNIHGGNGNDTLRGGADADWISGGAGDDTLEGGDGSDELVGGIGINTLLGEAGDDMLVGGSEVDTLKGGDGADRLFGNLGNDFLYGGGGNDVFEFRSAADTGIGASFRDRIFDWASGDRIDLSAIDANAVGGTSNDAFAFIGSAAFSGAGEIRVFTDANGSTIVEANLDDDFDTAEFEIELDRTVASLTPTDFVL